MSADVTKRPVDIQQMLTDERVAAFQAGWASVPKGEPGDRTRAGIAALDAYDREHERLVAAAVAKVLEQ